MKYSKFVLLSVIFLSIISHKTFAYDIAVDNADGVTIYYNYINNRNELEVTSHGIYTRETIVIPDEVIYMNNTWKVTSIGDFAFSGSFMTSIIIPNSINNIGAAAFQNCSSLTSIIIPNGVTSIRDYAFCGCSSLASITIPNSVTSIGKWAFYCCESLTSATIPNSVTNIGDQAFYLNKNLTSIIIGDGVTTIGESAFASCKSLTSVTIGKNVKTIQDYAFYNSIVSVIISKIENPFEITWKQFDYYSFTNATLYVPIGTVEKYKAKAGWKDFKHIEEVDSNDDNENTENSSLNYRITSNNECEVISGDNYSGDIIIPEYVSINDKKYKVTSIGEKAFKECRRLTSISIPNSVTVIGNEAFRNCEYLTSVNIPSGVTYIGDWAFCATSITSITIPNTVTQIRESVFNGCDQLTTISIPSSVTSIGRKAFYRCLSLKSINIPSNLSTIGELAFWECRSLTSLTIPNSIISIGVQAFSGEDEDAPNITTVISLIENPFEIYGKSSYFSEYLGIFTQNVFNNAILYVPKNTIDKYKATEGWKDFAHIEENNGETGISVVLGNETNTIYSIKGNSLQSSYKGINIIKLKDGTIKKIFVR